MASMKSSMGSLVSVGSIRKHSGTSSGKQMIGDVLAVVEQALSDVERGDFVVLGLFGEGEDELVPGAALGVGGLAADSFEALEQVVGGEGGVCADADHAFAAEHHGVEVGAQQHELVISRRFQESLRLNLPHVRAYCRSEKQLSLDKQSFTMNSSWK